MSRAHVVLGVSLLLGQLACGGGGCGPLPSEPETQCDTSLAAPAAETVIPGQLVGAGEFRPLASGDHLPLHAGVQGGYHVELAVRLYALTGAVWEHEIDVVPPSDPMGSRLGGTTERVNACAPGWSLTTGIRVFYYGPSSSSTGTPARIQLRSVLSNQPDHAVTAPPVVVFVHP